MCIRDSIWSKADFDSMQAFLIDVDWRSMIYCNPPAKALWDAFTSVFQTAVDYLYQRITELH